MSGTFQDRPIVDGREQRYRWELRRVNVERRTFVFIHDLRTYAEAVMYADVAVHQLGGDFVVWDNIDRKPLYDSRTMRGKFPPEMAEGPPSQ